MAEPLRIPVAELRRAAELLLAHVRESDGDVLELDQDMFWAVPPDALYDVQTEPPELTIAQLTDSWQAVSDVVHDEKPPIGYDLVSLADVLRALGLQIVG